MLLLLVVAALYAKGNDNAERHDGFYVITDHLERASEADSIMRLVIDKAIRYRDIVSSYESEIYIKGHTEILKQNLLIRLAHHLFPLDRKNGNMIFEMVSRSIYNAPQTYMHDLKAINGNSIPNEKKQHEALAFLNLNVYSPTAYDDAIFMPIASNAFRFYSFNVDDEEMVDGKKIYKIRFLPKQWSHKLVCGHIYITDNTWTVDRIDMNGKYSFAEFNLVINYGRSFQKFILPEKADLYLRYKALGNTVATTYHSSFKYINVEWNDNINSSKREKRSLDMTNYNMLSSDTVPIIKDSAYWNGVRDTPLTAEEIGIYNKGGENIESEPDSTTELMRYVKITERLTQSMNMDIKSTRIKYSGVLNPFQLGFSGRDGITYKQQFRLSKTFERDRQLRFHPQVGYVFKRKELHFKIGGDWEYRPEKRGVLSLEFGNRNESYSSEITNKINEELKDSSFNFSDLNLKYFKHYYAELKNSIELFNGFELITAISYHKRIAPKNNPSIDPGEDVQELLNKDYNDFTPTIGFSFTPRQYYRMDGYRKEYVYSHYPTLAVEFARGIPGVGKSIGDYGRVEIDIHQSLMLGLCRKLNYHISGGFYTQYKSTYFADFRYFTRRNFPDTWDDQIGGVFNLLDHEWFNSSDKYVQAHFMYESPFVLFKILRINSTRKFMQVISRYILSERFYLSQLWTPVLPSYTEIGYGIGNHIFNIGLFASFDRWRYQGMGVKFAFELFK